MKDSLKEDNPNYYHYVIEYSDLNGEIGMTSDVDKMNDKGDIVWNENNGGGHNGTDTSCCGATMYGRCFILSF